MMNSNQVFKELITEKMFHLLNLSTTKRRSHDKNFLLFFHLFCFSHRWIPSRPEKTSNKLIFRILCVVFSSFFFLCQYASATFFYKSHKRKNIDKNHFWNHWNLATYWRIHRILLIGYKFKFLVLLKLKRKFWTVSTIFGS